MSTLSVIMDILMLALIVSGMVETFPAKGIFADVVWWMSDALYLGVASKTGYGTFIKAPCPDVPQAQL